MRKRGRRPGEQTKVRTRLAEWRVKRGLTQEELAGLAGISRSKLNRLERTTDRTDMRVEDLAQLAIALDCAIDELLQPEWLQWRNENLTPEQARAMWREPQLSPARPTEPAPPNLDRLEFEIAVLLKKLPEELIVDGAVHRTSEASVAVLRRATRNARRGHGVMTFKAGDADLLNRLASLRETVPPSR